MNACPDSSGSPVTLVQSLRLGVHHYLDDADYCYQQLNLHLRNGLAVSVQADDPGGDAVAVEAFGKGRDEVVVVRRLGGVLSGAPAPAELVVRAAELRATCLTGK